MAIRETQYTKKFEADTEMEADSIVEGFKNNAIKEGYTVTKTKIDFKSKKGRRICTNKKYGRTRQPRNSKTIIQKLLETLG